MSERPEQFEVEGPGNPGREHLVHGSTVQKRNLLPTIFTAVLVLTLVAICGRAIWPSASGGDEPKQQIVEVKPPWWILQGVVPSGPVKDMGGWKATTFSEDQQDKFGVDELGAILDQKKFDAAIAARKVEAKASWWVVAGVKPEGGWKRIAGAEPFQSASDNGNLATFSGPQQKRFGINDVGEVIDQTKFNAAIASLFTVGNGMQVKPPWWIRHHVTPLGKQKDMGTWKAITFSVEQQSQFGIDELGVIMDRTKYETAISALNVGGVMVLPPWWILYHVAPEGPTKDMGSWTAATFSQEQQQQFGVDEQGAIQDTAKFDAAILALKANVHLSRAYTPQIV